MDFSPIIEKVKASIAFVVLLKDRKPIGQGSGFVYGKNKSLVTCNHIIQGDYDQILIKFMDDAEFISATIVIRDIEHDLVLLKFEGKTRKPLSVADQNTIKEGIGVLISGYPLFYHQ
jgi:S1-C subfamily serine protease